MIEALFHNSRFRIQSTCGQNPGKFLIFRGSLLFLSGSARYAYYTIYPTECHLVLADFAGLSYD